MQLIDSVWDAVVRVWPVLSELIGISLATFVGAWAAFRFEARYKQREALDQRSSAGRRAQFALVAQESVLRGLKNQHLDEFRDDAARYVKLKPISFFQDIPEIDFGSIDYLLDKPDPDLVNMLLDCQNKYNTVVGLVQERSRHHLRFQERMAEAEQAGRVVAVVTGERLEKMVGPELMGALTTLTNMLYGSVDAALEANEASFAALQGRLKTLFPKNPALARSLR